jgi:hypothetical protein
LALAVRDSAPIGNGLRGLGRVPASLSPQVFIRFLYVFDPRPLEFLCKA